MTPSLCPFEKVVVAAAKAEVWTDQLHDHIAACPLCAETIRLVKMMQAFALETTQISPPAPLYWQIWLKAQFAHREERLSKLEVLALRGASLVAAIGFIGLLLGNWPRFFAWLIHATKSAPSWPGLFSSDFSLAAASGLIVILCILIYDIFFAES